MLVLLQLVDLIIAAKIGGYLSKKLGQPAVLGEIISGMIIGPYVFGSDNFFGGYFKFLSFTRTQFIVGISEIGVVLLLFLIGLELDNKRLKENLKGGALVALLGVVIPFLFGVFLGYYFVTYTEMLSPSEVDNVNISHGVLLIFFASLLTATSVSITAKVLMEYNILNSKPALLILNAAVMDDVFTVLLFTIILAIVSTGTVYINEFLIIGISIALFFALIILIAPRIVEPLVNFGKYLDLRVEEGLFSVILAFIFLFSFIAKEVGLAPIIGAFFIGVIFTERSLGKDVVQSFEKISYGFFIPIFFTALGGYINPLDVIYNYKYVFLIFICIVAGKTLGAYTGARLTGLKPIDSLLVGFGMTPLLEVALIVAAFGVESNILSEKDFSVLVSSFMLTVVSAPVFIRSVIWFKNHSIEELFKIYPIQTTLWISVDPLLLAPGETGVLTIHVKNLGRIRANNVKIQVFSQSVDFLSPLPDVPLSVTIDSIKSNEEKIVEFVVAMRDDINPGGRYLSVEVSGSNIGVKHLDYEVAVIEPEIDIFVDEAEIAVGEDAMPVGKMRIELSNPTQAPIHDLFLEIRPQSEEFNKTSAIIEEILPEERESLEIEIIPKIKDLKEKKHMFEIVVIKGNREIASRFCEARVVDIPLVDFETSRGVNPALYYDAKLLPGETGTLLFRLRNWGWAKATNLRVWIEIHEDFKISPKMYHILSLEPKERTKALIFRYTPKKNIDSAEYLLHLYWNCDQFNHVEKDMLSIQVIKA